MKLLVPGDRIFVVSEAQPKFTKSGLEIVYARQRSTMKGTVVAVGDGPVSPKGVRLPHDVAVGDRILFSPDVGTEIFFERETLICMRESDVLGVIVEN